MTFLLLPFGGGVTYAVQHVMGDFIRRAVTGIQFECLTSRSVGPVTEFDNRAVFAAETNRQGHLVRLSCHKRFGWFRRVGCFRFGNGIVIRACRITFFLLGRRIDIIPWRNTPDFCFLGQKFQHGFKGVLIAPGTQVESCNTIIIPIVETALCLAA